MAQLQNVGQDHQAVVGSTLASVLLLMGLVFTLLGIKFFGFRRRLTFDRSQQVQQPQQQSQQPPRYAAYESQVNGTDTAVHGVFRRRNLEEFESPWPSVAAATPASSYITGSVPNLRLIGAASPKETRATEHAKVSYRGQTQSQRQRRLEVHSEHYEYYTAPPTRQPPSPPTQPDPAQAPVPQTVPSVESNEATAASPAKQSLPETAPEPPSELGMPNFSHFAEKYELISVQPPREVSRPTNLMCKNSGRYVKFEPVDDDPEILTPEDQVPELLSPDDGLGGPLSVIAVVHQGALPKTEPETPTETELQVEQPQDPDSAFVVEIIAGSPEAEVAPPLERNLFADLELPQGELDTDFQRIRSSFHMNEADILDVDQQRLPPPSSPPGFGKSIDEDWENFENLDAVAEFPEPNWALHPNSLEQVPTVEATLREATLSLDNVEQTENLFDRLELIEPRLEIFEPEPEPPAPIMPPPPPYDPGLPYLPDYESLMQLDVSRSAQNLPKYTEVMEQRSKKANYVSSIEDLYAELEVNETEVTGSGAAQSNGIDSFEELCQEMSVTEVPAPPTRPPPQPAPRSLRSSTLNVRGDAPPLACYQPEELPSSSSSDADGEVAVRSAPEPAKRVRFDVENLQYYQSAEVVNSSDESEEEPERPRPTPMQRCIVFDSETNDHGVPSLFGAQVSQASDSDEDDDGFGRAISQHRTMTAALRIHAVRGDTEA
ncbi:uncharacterized protein [Drosophila bipectinata]|uniref:uncharacterized protein n=1 Tax=Drosophila bipectinata TaxID=42026 RepID=UPI001C89E261|nr:titin [Drosophila bipectinata]